MSDPTTEFREWVKKAEEDWQGIRLMMAGPDVPWSLVCFHAQQAAEKYLKAFVVSRGQRAQRAHDLARLLLACRQHDSSLACLEADCVALSEYAVDIRYPDEERLAREAVAMAKRICNAIRMRLPKN